MFRRGQEASIKLSVEEGQVLVNDHESGARRLFIRGLLHCHDKYISIMMYSYA